VKGDKPGLTPVALDPVQHVSGHQDQLPDPQAIQRVMSGLEKLGLSVSNKASHLPFALEGIVQFLEKKVQESASVPQNSSMNAFRMAESVQEMPVGKGVTGQKNDSSNVFSEKKVTDFKSDMESRLMSADVPKQNMEKGGIFHKINTDSSPMQGDVSKGDGAGRQEIHQNLIAGTEKLQGPSISFTNVAESVSAPVKQSVVSQQSPLPTAVVNQVGKEIASFLHRGDRIFSLQLKPLELGMVNIEMDVKENVLKMSVVTETSSAKDMLHANYVDLKRVLEGYGIRVETFDVQVSSNLNHASATGDGFLNQQHSQGGMGKNIRFGKSVDDIAEDDTVEQSIWPQKNNEARLDLLA
ncbi:MAG: flagellar hook-length control protein FliK, partial [Desulfotignum sp.]|nr:flagellar hook-length control protein FliK [Desulfotignum sp.]MCF8136102.1 flagellar hook-length control protein FliK [Desulfotignum sp.]